MHVSAIRRTFCGRGTAGVRNRTALGVVWDQEGDEVTPEYIQKIIDAEEATTAARYERRREIVEMVGDAARRADAMSRLEAWLRYHPEPPAAPIA